MASLCYENRRIIARGIVDDEALIHRASTESEIDFDSLRTVYDWLTYDNELESAVSKLGRVAIIEARLHLGEVS